MKKYWLFIVLNLFVIQLFAVNLADFENKSEIPVLSADGGVFNVVPNPLKSGINVSDSVGYYHKTDTNWQYFTMTFNEAVEIGLNNTLTFQVNAGKQGRIFAKFWYNGAVLIESWAPEWNFMPTANKWIECTMDMTPAMGKKFDVLQIAACVDNLEEAEVHLDNFQLSNPDAVDGSPFNLFNVSKSLIEKGDSIVFDASDSYDYDGDITSYLWDFGDGITDTGMIIHHVFDTSGVFSVNLQLTDNDNKTSNKNTYVFVSDTNEKLTGLKFISDAYETNEKIEGIFHVNKSYLNVFNPDEVTVDAQIIFPDQSTINMPCFYFEKSSFAKSKWIIDNSLSCWMFRFSSPQQGNHKIVLKLHDNEGDEVSDTVQLVINEGNKKGVIKRDNTNPQYYRHNSGEAFYPMGINEGWDNITNYTTIIKNLGQNNANIIRYWHAGFNGQSLEWTGGTFKGLGFYNQEASAKLDSLLVLCDKNDVYMQMVIFQHGMFSENVNPNWEYSPYNITNGGLIDRAEKFFYNEACKEYVRKLLRYIIARWGYSPNVFAWEFFNEVQFTGIHNAQTSQWYPGVLKWHSEMASFMKMNDPYDHLTTTSAADDQLPDLDTIKNLDVVQYHLYNDNLYDHQKYNDDHFKSALKYSSIINGEYGTNNETDVPMEMQRHLIWTSIMTQVPRFMWIWDHYLDINWAGLFEMPGQFLSDLDLSQENNLDYTDVLVQGGGNTMKALCIKSDKNGYGYVYDAGNQMNLTNIVAKIKNLPYANYKLTYYLPVENKIVTIDSIALVSDQVKLELPVFSQGIAFKIIYLSAYTNPIAIAGVDTIVSPGSKLQLTGIKSVNPAGKPLSYTWRVVSKPVGSVADVTSVNTLETEFTPDVVGDFEIGLVVNDDSHTSTENILTVSVTALPVAIAGNDMTVSRELGKFINLDGSGSYDPEGNKLTYVWQMISKPAGSDGMMFAADLPNSIARIDSIGAYLITLTVNDGITNGLPDTVRITITPPTAILLPDASYYLKIGPNPFSNQITIENPDNNLHINRIEMVDVQGIKKWEKVYSTNEALNTIMLNPENMHQGIYLLRIVTSAGILHKIILRN